MLSSIFCYLVLQQQIDTQALEKAMAADAAAKAAQTPAAAAAPPGAPAEGAGAAVPPPAGFAAQQAVRAPGGSLLNPALSFILDSSFGYYGRDSGQFAALGLPIAGDDPSDVRQGFGVQEIELAAQSAIDPYMEGAIFLTIPNLEGIEVEEAYLVTTSLPAESPDQGRDVPLPGRAQQRPAPPHAELHAPAAHDLSPVRGGRVARAGRAGVGAAAAPLVRDPLRRGIQHRPARGPHAGRRPSAAGGASCPRT